MMNNISRQQAYEMMLKSKGRFFSVEFIKRTNGQLRRMNCRLGVKGHLKGGSLKYNAKDRGLICVWDSRKKQYRMVNLETLVYLTMEGLKYEIKI